MTDNSIDLITASVVAGDPEETLRLTREAIERGVEPLAIIDQGFMVGMNAVGEKFAAGEYFIPHLVMAGKAMQSGLEYLEPELRTRQQSPQTRATVVMATVQGDIHEIGKSLVATMLSANGFQVHDMGVDVPIDTLIEKVKKTGAHILGLSALLTTTMTVQREVINALIDAGIRDQIKVLVGGAPVSQNWADSIGADGYADDAMGAVRLAKQIIA